MIHEREDGTREEWRVNVVPAAPGWCVIGCYAEISDHFPESDVRRFFWCEPIIAWGIQVELSARYDEPKTFVTVKPITIQNDMTDLDRPLLRPDGVIDFPDDRTFETPKPAWEYLCALEKEKEQRRLALAAKKAQAQQGGPGEHAVVR